MKKRILIVLAMIATVYVVYELLSCFVYVGQGGSELTIRIRCSESPPSAIACTAEWHKFEAERWTKSDSKIDRLFEREGRSALALPFDGKPLTVHILTDSTVTIFGRVDRWQQHEYLAVVADWPDGRRISKVVAIPDVRKSREITVDLP